VSSWLYKVYNDASFAQTGRVDDQCHDHTSELHVIQVKQRFQEQQKKNGSRRHAPAEYLSKHLDYYILCLRSIHNESTSSRTIQQSLNQHTKKGQTAHVTMGKLGYFSTLATSGTAAV
jgi:hypothetical protein